MKPQRLGVRPDTYTNARGFESGRCTFLKEHREMKKRQLVRRDAATRARRYEGIALST